MQHRRSKVPRRIAAWLGAAASVTTAVVAAFGGCADLSALTPNTCGNLVLEDGEDCDGEPNCGEPGGVNACRYLCTPAKDDCPTNWSCGNDGLCRQHAPGRFEVVQTLTTDTMLDLATGDTNGDRCSEIFDTTIHGTYVTSFESRAPGTCSAGEQLLVTQPPSPQSTTPPAPMLFDLTSDARPEFVLGAQGLLSTGLFVYSTDQASALSPLLYSSLPFNENTARLLRARVRGADTLILFGQDVPGQGDGGAPAMGGAPQSDAPPPPPPDGGMPPLDGGPPPDGGMPPLDGGMPPLDGGMLPDGGMEMDGGMPPPDGGFPDGGLPPLDGGMPPPDGGLPPPDGGMEMDGGMPGMDAGLPDGGGPPTDDGKIHVAAVTDPAVLPDAITGLDGQLPALTLRAADLDRAGSSEPACDEVVFGAAGGTRIQAMRICQGTGFGYTPLPDVLLPAATKLRSTLVTLAVADMDGDGNKDIVTNVDGDPHLYVAYGLGDGTFDASPHPTAPGDQRMSVLPVGADVLAMLQQTSPQIAVIGQFDALPPAVPTVRVIACPPSPNLYRSPACNPAPGSCEAVVADIDGDGYDDVVMTQEQQPGLIVLRGHDGPGFHQSFLDTQCPAHAPSAGDFDNDGIVDIAVLDQVTLPSGVPVTAVSVAYGKPFAPPEALVGGALLPFASELAGGHFQQMAAGDQLFASRTVGAPVPGIDGGAPQTQTGAPPTALALVEGDDQRQMLAPFYFPGPKGDAQRRALIRYGLLASAGGRFSVDADGGVATGLAVVTQDPPVSGSTAPLAITLQVVEGNPATGSLTVPPEGGPALACASCVIATLPAQDGGKDALVVLGDKLLTVYEPSANGFTQVARQTLTASFVSSTSDSNPSRYVPRPLVFDLDRDGNLDVVARATTGELVVFWGEAGGTFAPVRLLDNPCDASAVCGALESVALVGEDAKGTLEIAVVDRGRASIYGFTMTPKATRRTPQWMGDLPSKATPPPDTDFTSVVAADFDGDGVTDVAIATSSTFIFVLRGTPVRE